MKLIIEVTEVMSDAQVRSELQHIRGIDMGYAMLGDLPVKVLGRAVERPRPDGFGGRIVDYELEEL